MGVIKGHLGRQMGHYTDGANRGDFLNQTKPEVMNLNQAMTVFRHNVRNKKTLLRKGKTNSKSQWRPQRRPE